MVQLFAGPKAKSDQTLLPSIQHLPLPTDSFRAKLSVSIGIVQNSSTGWMLSNKQGGGREVCP